jgi:probable rRNA maturation factor
LSTILVNDRQKHLTISEAAVRKLAVAVLKDLELDEGELSIVFCDDEWIAELNKSYLDREGPTNVMSFPPAVSAEEPEEGETVLLGDVVINVQRAIRDAEEAGTDAIGEAAFLLIHGICHLAGFDHEGDGADRALEMEAAEDRLFQKYGTFMLKQE